MKLSKEQAAWLIEKIMNSPDYSTPSNDMAAGVEMCIETINECIEKEFPRFELIMDESETRINIDFLHRCAEDGVALNMDIMFAGQHGGIILYAKEFRQLVEGCNKIIDWLGNQE